MIYAYGITQQGTWHIKKNIVCQDAHSIIKCADNMAVAAVADGLGSEIYSDTASKIAAELSVQYVSSRITPESGDEEILQAVHESFTLAQNTIEKTAEENGHPADQYDTTLSLAVLLDDRLYYGHSGDSGIIALTTDGLFCKVTEPQNDELGLVYPLCFREAKWEFKKFDKPAASVFLATDGIYETLFPIYIREEPVSIYTALAQYFMDPQSLQFETDGEQAVQDRMAAFLAGISGDQVNDDKTAVVLANPETVISRQPEAYYAEPDWDALIARYQESWKRKAYPHLYVDQDEDGNSSQK